MIPFLIGLLAGLMVSAVIKWQLSDERESFEPQTSEEIHRRFKQFKQGINK